MPPGMQLSDDRCRIWELRQACKFVCPRSSIWGGRPGGASGAAPPARPRGNGGGRNEEVVEWICIPPVRQLCGSFGCHASAFLFWKCQERPLLSSEAGRPPARCQLLRCWRRPPASSVGVVLSPTSSYAAEETPSR